MKVNHLDYAVLESAGTERYTFTNPDNPINYPPGEVVEWYGYRRHNFELNR